MKSRSKNQPQTVRRIPVHELFPQPDTLRRQASAHPRSPTSQAARQQPAVQKFQPARRQPSHAPVRLKTPTRPLLWASVFLVAMSMIFASFAMFKRDNKNAYVLLEVRAIEKSGHPVAAAQVKINDQTFGVTDSFGEWRRYMSLSAGDDVTIELAKKGNDKLVGKKVTRVPLDTKGQQDVELRVSIEMDAAHKPVAQPEKVSPPPAPPVAENSWPKAAPLPRREAQPEVKAEAVVEDSTFEDSISDTNDSSLGIYFDDGLNRLSIQAPEVSKTGTLLDRRQQQVVRDRVLPVMMSDLQNLGLSVDAQAPWKLRLSYVANGDQVGYIRAEMDWQTPFGQREKNSFIAPFAKTYEETGRGLSSLLRLHMKKSYWAFKDNGNWFIDEPGQTKDFWRLQSAHQLVDTSGEKFSIQMVGQNESGRRWRINLGRDQPCASVRQRTRCMMTTQSLKEAPPVAGWAMKRVKVLGSVPENAKVYVAGFQAHAVGGGVYEFWSRPGSSLKAVVVQGSRLIHAETFADHPGQAVVLKLASAAPKKGAH